MRISLRASHILSAAALTISAGCSAGSGGGGSAPISLAPQPDRQAPSSVIYRAQWQRTGAVRSLPVSHGAPVKGFFSKAALAPGGAMGFISDVNNNVVYIVSAQGATTATLTGFTAPDGMSTDKSGNLYVTNNGAANVFELAPPYNGTPTVYSDPNEYPVMVAVDGHGNLAVTSIDNTSAGEGDIAFYKAGSTTPTSTIQDPNFYTFFCAFDANGNLYVDGVNFNTGAELVGEVVGGINGTSITQLSYSNTITCVGGIQVTNAGDIAVDDQCGYNIYTYNPPSNGSLGSPIATTPLGGAKDPVNFALSHNNHVAAVADNGLGQANKYPYPAGGSPIATTNFTPGAGPIGAAINPTDQYAQY